MDSSNKRIGEKTMPSHGQVVLLGVAMASLSACGTKEPSAGSIQLPSTGAAADTSIPRAPFVDLGQTVFPPAILVSQAAGDGTAAPMSDPRDLDYELARLRPALGIPSLLTARVTALPIAIPASDLRVTGWATVDHLAGPPVPDTFQLVEQTPHGASVCDYTISPHENLIYPMVIIPSRRFPTMSLAYELLDDGVGIRSFLIPQQEGIYRFMDGGPLISEQEIVAHKGAW
jgi:hypothetical protein